MTAALIDFSSLVTSQRNLIVEVTSTELKALSQP